MRDDFTAIAKAPDPILAEMMKGFLVEHGIEVIVRDAAPYPGLTVNGALILVRRSNAEEATALLHAFESGEVEPIDDAWRGSEEPADGAVGEEEFEMPRAVAREPGRR